MSQYIRVLKPVSAVGAGGEVGFVVPPGKCLGMYIIFCNKISCQKKKDLINVLLFFFFFSSKSSLTGTILSPHCL